MTTPDEEQALRREWSRANSGGFRRSLRGARIWFAVGGGFVAGALTLAALFAVYRSRVDARNDALERRARGEIVFAERDEPVFGLNAFFPATVVTFAVASFLKKRLDA